MISSFLGIILFLENNLVKTMEATLILPNQLFASHPAIKKGRPIWLAEEFLFFKIHPFHRQRLILLRSAMKEYEAYLKKQDLEVYYIESNKLSKRGDIFKLLGKKKLKELHIAEETDDWLNQDLQKSAHQNGWKLHIYPSPMFLCAPEDLLLFFKGKNHYSMAPFYAAQRKKLNILMNNGKPEGGGNSALMSKTEKNCLNQFLCRSTLSPDKQKKSKTQLLMSIAIFQMQLATRNHFFMPRPLKKQKKFSRTSLNIGLQILETTKMP